MPRTKTLEIPGWIVIAGGGGVVAAVVVVWVAIVANRPYQVVEAKVLPSGQCLVQVVVPKGATIEDIRKWHPKVVRTYRRRADDLVVNYYDAHFADYNLVAQGFAGPDGGPVWIGEPGPGK